MSSNSEYKLFTFTYDPINHIDLDIYIPTPTSDDINDNSTDSLPGVISFHGGGFTSGSKKDVYFPSWLLERCIKQKIIFISPNYRLFHPSRGSDILEDVETLFKYLSSDSSELLTTLNQLGYSLNLGKLSVIGFSAGEYLARASWVLPSMPNSTKPKSFIGFYGLSGQFLSDHWIQTKEEGKVLPGVPYNKEQVLQAFGNPPSQRLSDSTLSFNFNSDAAHRFGLFSLFYNKGQLVDYLLNEPGLSKTLEGIPVEERINHIPEDKKHLLLPLNKDMGVPKIMLVHGENDLIVPIESSKEFKNQLDNLGIESTIRWVKNAGHGLLDINNFPNFVPEINDIQDDVFTFIVNSLE